MATTLLWNSRHGLLIFSEVLGTLCLAIKGSYERVAKALGMSVDTLDRAREGKATHSRIEKVTNLYWETVSDEATIPADSVHYLQRLMIARRDNALGDFWKFHRVAIESAHRCAKLDEDLKAEVGWGFVLAYCYMWKYAASPSNAKDTALARRALDLFEWIGSQQSHHGMLGEVLMMRFPVTLAMAHYNVVEFKLTDPATLLMTDRLFRRLKVLEHIDKLLEIVPNDEIGLRNGVIAAAVQGEFEKASTYLDRLCNEVSGQYRDPGFARPPFQPLVQDPIIKAHQHQIFLAKE